MRWSSIKVMGVAVASAGMLGAAALTAGPLASSASDAAAQQSQDRQARTSAETSEATLYRLDPVHSSVAFKIDHMNLAPFIGRFNDINGRVRFDPESPEACHFDVTINAASVDTRNENRDNHLRSGDFFTVAEYPVITFKSTKIEQKKDKTYNVTGDLTFHGTTKSITVEIKNTGLAETRQGHKIGFWSQFDIKRSDYGMDYGIENDALGDTVTIMLGLEAAAREE